MILKGKRAVFMGDSITEGVGVRDRSNMYHNLLKQKAELASAYVDGISGSRIANQLKPSDPPRCDLYMCARAYNLPKDADLVVVYGGVNDYGHGDASFGTPDDTTPETFTGAVDFLMKYLTENYKNATVVFMTPARCVYGGVSCEEPSRHPYKCGNGRPLSDYVEVIVACGKKYGIPVLNLYTDLPINPLEPGDRAEYTADGLHLNDCGQGVLADTLFAFLKAL